MSVDVVKAVVQGLGHAAKKEHANGNHNKANGWTLIGFGVFLLPVPIIGIPLIVAGIWKLCS